jgi:hypothetical protein
MTATCVTPWATPTKTVSPGLIGIDAGVDDGALVVVGMAAATADVPKAT